MVQLTKSRVVKEITLNKSNSSAATLSLMLTTIVKSSFTIKMISKTINPSSPTMIKSYTCWLRDQYWSMRKLSRNTKRLTLTKSPNNAQSAKASCWETPVLLTTRCNAQINLVKLTFVGFAWRSRKKSLLTILASSTFYSAQIYNLKTLERRGICAAKDLPSSQKCLGFKFTSWVKVLFGDELKETMRKLERAVLSILLLGGST